MTHIALFGATGTIGREILKQSLENGHSVQALVRDSTRIGARPGLTVIQGDATDVAVVSRAIAGADAVIDAIGPRANVPEAVDVQVATMTVILGAMRQHGAVRIIAVTGAAISLESDERVVAHRIAGAVVRRLVRHVVEAKRREFELLRVSDREWIAVRPTRVVPRPGRGTLRVDRHRPTGMTIRVADLAAFILSQLESDEYVRAAPFVSS